MISVWGWQIGTHRKIIARIGANVRYVKYAIALFAAMFVLLAGIGFAPHQQIVLYGIGLGGNLGRVVFFSVIVTMCVSFVAVLICGAHAVARQAVSMRRQHRISRGLCGNCGYDLRASSMQCPECGTKFDRKEPVRKSCSDATYK
jgi:predicted RNA-binding Zn-ribbon protein involved in translation (DUF1610 family)